MGFSAKNSQPVPGSSKPAESPQRPSTVGAEPSAAKDDSYRALLDAVVQQTLLAQNAAVQERLESLDELLEMARRRRGQAFELDPVGIELVQTVLSTPFRALVASEDQWHAMSRQVAQTLCDDPAAYDRLSTLWRRLGERCGDGN